MATADEISLDDIQGAVNNAFGKKSSSVTIGNQELQSRLEQAQSAWYQKFGKELPITSGVRSRAEQEKLFRDAGAGKPGVYMPINPATKPGQDVFHANAVDISTEVPEAFLNQYGIHRPLGKRDPVHAVLMPNRKPLENVAQESSDDINLGDIEEAVKQAYFAPTKPEAKQQVVGSVKKAASDFGPGLASVLDVTVGGIIPQVAGAVTYAGARALQKTPAEASALEKQVAESVDKPFGKAFGVTETEGYKNEASRQLMDFVGENINKGAQWISDKTGLPVSDVQNMIGTATLAAPELVKTKPVQAVIKPIAEEAKIAAEAAKTGVNALKQKAQTVEQQVRGQFEKIRPGQTAPAGSVGAAGVEQGLQRQQRAAELLVPMDADMTKSMITRNPADVQWERETAKSPEFGGPLQEKYAAVNSKLQQNLQAEVEHTGAEKVGIEAGEFGKEVSDTVQKYKNERKSEVDNLYQQARDAGEMAQPISYQGLFNYIRETTKNRPTLKSQNPILSIVEEEIKANDPTGTGTISLNAMEDIRQLINSQMEPTQKGSLHFGNKLKQKIDKATKDAGGDLYKEARKKYGEFENEFENQAVIRDINRFKKGGVDRAVAFEDMVKHTMLKGPKSDVQAVFSTLEKAGPEGQQLINELRGAVAEHIKQEATKGVGRDINGKPYVSTAALDKQINALDKSGKLDLIFGKEQAARYRTLNEVTKDMQTTPQGTVNTSGTTSTLLSALAEAGVTTAVTGVPAPVITIGTHLYKRQKAKQKMQKVMEYANPTNKLSDIGK